MVNHCQITDRVLPERIARNNLCVAYQPVFLDCDLHIAESRVGRDKASTSYAFRSLDELGAHIAYGSDAPVEDCNPFAGLYCAVTRCDKNGIPDGGWFPGEKVDIETAVDAYTVGSAYQEFHENDKGRIMPGYMADMVVLDTDIFTCDPHAILTTRPVMTLIGGEVVFRRNR